MLAIAGAEENEPIRAGQSWWGRKGQVMAIAASILLVVGLLGYEYTVLFPSEFDANTYAMGVAIPEDLESDLVIQQQAAAQSGAARGSSQVDFSALSKDLSAKIGQRAFARALRGWSFRSSSVVQVQHALAAQVAYGRGDQTVAVLSMPAEGMNLGRYGMAEGSQGNYHMTAFIHNHGLYAVVGSSPDGKLTLADVRDIRQQVAFAVSNPITSRQLPGNLASILP
jgi:hypothetical protein